MTMFNKDIELDLSEGHKAALASIRAAADKCGFAVVGSEGNGHRPDVTCTVGLLALLGYELVTVGMPCRWASQMFNEMYEAPFKKGEKLDLTQPDDRWCNLPQTYKVVTHDMAVWGEPANLYHGQETPFVQVVIPDREGRFPGDPSFDHKYMHHRQFLLYDVAPLAVH